MAEAIILELEGVGAEDYKAVNEVLGIDMSSGQGDWPEGLVSHTAAASADGWVGFEVWDSEEAQERSTGERLAAALQEGRLEGEPSRVERLDLEAPPTPST